VRPARGRFLCLPQRRKNRQKEPRVGAVLLEKAHIATIPGSVFGAQGEGHLRFTYALPIKEIEDCVEALRKFFA